MEIVSFRLSGSKGEEITRGTWQREGGLIDKVQGGDEEGQPSQGPNRAACRLYPPEDGPASKERDC